MTRIGFPHSDIFGSMLTSSSPKLFAGSRVFHRLLVPRHSLYALINLTLRKFYKLAFFLIFFFFSQFLNYSWNHDFSERTCFLCFIYYPVFKEQFLWVIKLSPNPSKLNRFKLRAQLQFLHTIFLRYFLLDLSLFICTITFTNFGNVTFSIERRWSIPTFP